MNVATIKMTRGDAAAAFREYQAAVRADRPGIKQVWRQEDRGLMRAYKAISRGQQVLDLHAGFKRAGSKLYDHCPVPLPQLAICPSDGQTCHLKVYQNGSARFSDEKASWRAKRRVVTLPGGTLPPFESAEMWRHSEHKTTVPMIPPHLRPKHDLGNYFTLWEVESWTLDPSRDPMLLKSLGGALYAVLATWDLTDVERAILRNR